MVIEALIAVIVVLGIALGICAIEVWALPGRRRRCLVNLIGDEGTLEGVLWNRRGAWLVVKDARLHPPNGGEPVRADGDVLIFRGHVAFIQVF